MDEKTLMQIKKEYGISRRAIQGYEKNGLVKPTGRTIRGYLLYDEAAVKRIREIKLYQKMGFQIREIKELIDAPTEIKKTALYRRREELAGTMEELARVFQIMQELIEQLENSDLRKTQEEENE